MTDCRPVGGADQRERRQKIHWCTLVCVQRLVRWLARKAELTTFARIPWAGGGTVSPGLALTGKGRPQVASVGVSLGYLGIRLRASEKPVKVRSRRWLAATRLLLTDDRHRVASVDIGGRDASRADLRSRRHGPTGAHRDVVRSLAWPGLIGLGLFSEAVARGSLVVAGDAVATARNIAGNPQVWRLGLVADVLTQALDLPFIGKRPAKSC